MPEQQSFKITVVDAKEAQEARLRHRRSKYDSLYAALARLSAGKALKLDFGDKKRVQVTIRGIRQALLKWSAKSGKKVSVRSRDTFVYVILAAGRKRGRGWRKPLGPVKC